MDAAAAHSFFAMTCTAQWPAPLPEQFVRAPDAAPLSVPLMPDPPAMVTGGFSLTKPTARAMN
ncbi:hypothetical protein MPHLEI_14779 [Mycolicibacterium phlei RIVM601174]|uniref:hypothetical protein n=1 Tax=Mycolicibacterium phlei TaxID=1771 RepID=UPI00025AEEAB|nr:hypothetical protein [Mycolicibacterium phlei]EID13274.1 hypothetical protein MPHLEI_14779 [Mycolicibacterium phlei RIVM601174]